MACLEPHDAARQRGLEQQPEQGIGEHRDADAEGGRHQEGPPLHQERQHEQQRASGEDESNRGVEPYGQRCDDNDTHGMRGVGPGDGDRLARAADVSAQATTQPPTTQPAAATTQPSGVTKTNGGIILNFQDASVESGLANASWVETSFGTAFFDYDNDGWLDLLVANGAVAGASVRLSSSGSAKREGACAGIRTRSSPGGSARSRASSSGG